MAIETEAGRKLRIAAAFAVGLGVTLTSRARSAPVAAAVRRMTAFDPAFQAALVTDALIPHFTESVELLPFAVTVKVPEPLGPVSQISEIVSGPAAAAVGVGVGQGARW